jgi:hypothetical protein
MFPYFFLFSVPRLTKFDQDPFRIRNTDTYTCCHRGRNGHGVGKWVRKGKEVDQGITKRCRLSWLTNSAFEYEPKCGGRGSCRGRPMSTAVHRSPNKLWRSNSIFFTYEVEERMPNEVISALLLCLFAFDGALFQPFSGISIDLLTIQITR